MEQINIRFMGFLAALVCLTFMPVVFSCNDDDSNDLSIGQTDVVEIDYEIELSRSWYQYFDILVTYTDANGNIKSETVTADKDIKFRVNYDSAPQSFQFTVSYTPKSVAPTVIDGQSVMFKQECSMEVDGYTRDNRPTSLKYEHEDNDQYSLTPAELRDRLPKSDALFFASYRLEKK